MKKQFIIGLRKDPNSSWQYIRKPYKRNYCNVFDLARSHTNKFLMIFKSEKTAKDFITYWHLEKKYLWEIFAI